MLKHKEIGEDEKCFKLLKHLIRKMQQAHLQLPKLKRQESCALDCGEEGEGRGSRVPEDVKEGHFAVFAAKSQKPQKFIVELQLLTNPAFLRLLKLAEEEYGFNQKGVLALPCQPEELQNILLNNTADHSNSGQI